jgi:hypothetical protein
MRLQEALEELSERVDPSTVSLLGRHIPFEWIEQAIASSEGMATLRKRRLPASQVIWLVLGMALFRKHPIDDLVDKLDLALPDPRFPTVAPSAVSQARARVGEEPMQRLFDRCSSQWAHDSADSDRWRGLAVYGVDGSTLRVADTPENRQHFGGQSAGKRGDSGYPLVRAVTLMALRSHLLAAVRFGPYSTGEVTYAKELWSTIPNNSLTIEDRGFLNAGALIPLASEGENRHWLTRAKSNTAMTFTEVFESGDGLVDMKVSSAARKANPSLPKTWRVRAVRYQRRGFQPQILLTSLLDPVAYPACELAQLYHERWELELGYDEIKTHMLEREESLRSRTVAGVNQELWGIFLAYNLIRREMEGIAVEAGVAPTRISFTAAMRFIVNEWMWCALSRSPGAIPKNLQRLRANVKKFILPPRRTERVYPRAVKIKMSAYPRKRPKIQGLQAI